MTLEQIAKAHDARPFRPFRIRMADGTSYEVNHPELLARTNRIVLVAIPENDSFAVLDVMLITAIEVGVHGDGKKRRKAG